MTFVPINDHRVDVLDAQVRIGSFHKQPNGYWAFFASDSFTTLSSHYLLTLAAKAKMLDSMAEETEDD